MLKVWTTDTSPAINKALGKYLNKDNTGIVWQDKNSKEMPPFLATDVVLCLGGKVLEILEAHGVTPKKRKITSLRGQVFTMPCGARLMVSFSASIRDVDYGMFVDLCTDVQLAIRLEATGTLKPKLGNYKWVDDFTEVINFINNSQGYKAMTLDLETLGLNEYADVAFIVSVFITYQSGESIGIHFKNQAEEKKGLAIGSHLHKQLSYILNHDRIKMRGANLKFDLRWIAQRTGIECSNFKMDTMLVGSLLDENRSNSLEMHTKIYVQALGGYDAGFNAKYDKSRMDLVDKTDLLDYAGGDTDACFQVAEKELAELQLPENKGLANFYIKLLHPAARAYEKVERAGILVDQEVYHDLGIEIETEMMRLNREAINIVGGRISLKHRPLDGSPINITKAAFIKDYMFSPMGLNLKPKMQTEKSGEPSTALEHLLMFEHHPDAKAFIDVIKVYGSATKTLSTYVVGFLKHLRTDGRFHPTYMLFKGAESGDEGGTVTGRLSARDPAIQTLPKHTSWAKKLRAAIIAPEGYVILSSDYSQGELKIAACLAQEPTMLHAYSQGIDLHAMTASGLMGWAFEDFMKLLEDDPELFAEYRQRAKAANFGLLYGMGVEGFQAYAFTAYGVIMTLDEAETARNRFFSTYPVLLDWHRGYKAIAKRGGRIVSPLGRIRHLPLITSQNSEQRSRAERQAINSPVQGTLSDMSLWATSIFNQNGWLEESPVVAMVHDALVSYVPEDNWDFYARRNKDVMENLPFNELDWNPPLQFTVDVEIGKNLRDMVKQKM